MRSRVLLVSLVAMVGVAGAQEPDGQVSDGELVQAYAPLQAVAWIPETGQVLVYDEQAKAYALVRVGDRVGSWKIVAIEAQRVVVVNGSEREELGYVSPPAEIRGLGATATGEKKKVVVEEKQVEEKPEKVTTKIVEEKRSVTRAELDRELGDFDRITAAVDVEEAKGGGFLLSRVDEKSWIHKLGLRGGDAVRAVAGEQVSTVEDAARVYARLKSLKAFAIELDRGGKRHIIHVEVLKGKRPGV